MLVLTLVTAVMSCGAETVLTLSCSAGGCGDPWDRGELAGAAGREGGLHSRSMSVNSEQQNIGYQQSNKPANCFFSCLFGSTHFCKVQ